MRCTGVFLVGSVTLSGIESRFPRFDGVESENKLSYHRALFRLRGKMHDLYAIYSVLWAHTTLNGHPRSISS